MRKKITFFILNGTGSVTKQISITKTSLIFIPFLVFFCFIALGFIGYDYYNLKGSALKAQKLEARLENQSTEINNQRRQIQDFAIKINDLKTKLVELNNFEKKVRIIANLESSDEKGSFFGVGGSIPEDLDAKMPLTEQHNSLLREMHDQMGGLKHAVLKQENDFSSLLKSLEKQRNLLASTPAIRPTDGWITSNFGYRESPFTGKREFHKGLDIANKRGTSIYATADGVVSYASKKGFLGNLVMVDHGHGLVTRYAHLEKIVVKKGDKIKRGDKVGLMGNSGRSTGPHLHYEIVLNGVPVNPKKYILN